LAHQPRVAHDIGCQYRRQPPLYSLPAHLLASPERKAVAPRIVGSEGPSAEFGGSGCAACGEIVNSIVMPRRPGGVMRPAEEAVRTPSSDHRRIVLERRPRISLASPIIRSTASVAEGISLMRPMPCPANQGISSQSASVSSVARNTLN